MSERRDIVVVGAGVVGATAALALARALPPSGYRITVVPTAQDAEDLGIGASVEASQPSIRAFHAELGIDEAALVGNGVASFSLGTAYTGWMGADARPSFAPFGDIGAPLGGVAFHQFVTRLVQSGHPLRSTDFSIAALMAQAGRFTRPSDDPRSPLSAFTYGLHLHSAAYAEHLLALAERLGARRLRSTVASVQRSAAGVELVELADGSRLSAQLLVEASHGGLAAAGDWEPFFGTDRLLRWDRADDAPPAPYGLVAAHRAGWHRSIPGPGRVGELLAYSTADLEDKQALALARQAGVPDGLQPVAVSPGRRDQPWVGNVIAIGGAAARLEPLAPVALHCAQAQVRRLLRLLPATADMSREAAEYNRETIAELDRTQDHLQLRYALNARRREPFWDRARAAPVSAALADKIRLFRSRGRVPLLDGDEFGEPDWAAALEAHGIVPERYEALADGVPLEQLTGRLLRLREIMLQAIAPLPRHGDYLARHAGRVAA